MSTQSATVPAGGAELRSAPAPRLVSLDAFRGFTMFWLMGGKAFILALAALAGGPVAGFVTYELAHSEWEGLRYYDLIWPSFMLMVGVSVPFSFVRRKSMGHVWKRAAVLFLLGSLRESMSTGTPHLIELSSALQPIAVAYLVAAYLAGRSVRTQAAVAVGILVAYALVLALVPAPGIAAGGYEMNRNIVTFVDERVAGRAHPEGWGTVLSTIPTISTTLLGLLLGRLLLSGAAPQFCIKAIGGAGLACLGAGFALSFVIPVVMKLWTVSYGLMSAGWACLIFLLFYWLIDARGYKRWTFPLVVIGTNAIAAARVELGKPDLAFIPVELGGGQGTANSHWDERDGGVCCTGYVDGFGRDATYELMTGWLNAPTFISQTTIQSFVDIGYVAGVAGTAGMAAVVGMASFVGAIPEPDTYLMLLAGLCMLGVALRRAKHSIVHG
jgi:predicted acyltransferase